MRKVVVVQLMNEAFNGRNSISVFNFSTELKEACVLLRIQEVVAVWLFPEYMIGLVLFVISVRLTMVPNDANRDQDTITTYAKLANY